MYEKWSKIYIGTLNLVYTKTLVVFIKLLAIYSKFVVIILCFAG